MNSEVSDMREFETDELETSDALKAKQPTVIDETFTTSPEIGELAAALAKAQETIKDPERTHTGRIGNQEFKYADLADCLAAVRPALSPQGLAITQWPHGSGWVVTVTTLLIHSSGQWLRCDRTILVEKGRGTMLQSEGEAVSYTRRYGVCGVSGIAQSDQDPDAGPQIVMINEEQLKALRKKISDSGSDENLFCSYLRVASLDCLPADNIPRAEQALVAAAEKRNAEQKPGEEN